MSSASAEGASPRHEVAGSSAPRTTPVGTCPLCGSPDSEFLFEIPDRLFGVPGTFCYRRCDPCGTVYQDPRVTAEALSECYPADYATHALPPEAPPIRSLSSLRESMRRAVVAAVLHQYYPGRIGWLGKLLARHPVFRRRAFFFSPLAELAAPPRRGRRALDVGCGAGVLLLDLVQRGWDAEGVEWDATSAELARKVTNRLIHVGDFRTAGLPLATYDLIVLQHVLEHLDNLRDALQHISALLAPNGRAVLVYPNPRSLGARRFQHFWFAWDAPRHLALPPPSAVAAQAARVGLRVVRVRTSARAASVIAANSRAYSNGTRANQTQPGFRDRAFGMLQRVLVALGQPVGEEAVVVLEKHA